MFTFELDTKSIYFKNLPEFNIYTNEYDLLNKILLGDSDVKQKC